MKIKAILIAAGFGAALTAIVSAEWLPVSPGSSWYDYCRRGGSKLNTLHACFKAHPSLLKKLINETTFKGYLAPDAGHFVLLPPSDYDDAVMGSDISEAGDVGDASDDGGSGGLNTALVLDNYTVDVSFYIDGKYAPPQDKCSRVTIYQRPSKVTKIFDMCGKNYMHLPWYLWE